MATKTRSARAAKPKRIVLGCAHCRGSAEPGWVCEEHPEQPMGHRGCGGAGGPCPVCNKGADVAWTHILGEYRAP